MRILLDTNVLVRAVLSPGGPAAALVPLLQPPRVFVSSLSVLEEVASVLRRDRVRRIHQRNDVMISRQVDELRSLASTFVCETRGDRIVPHDPNDDHVVTTAILGDADVLVTLDRHLRNPDVLAYCLRHGVRVLTDTELLAELRAGGTV